MNTPILLEIPVDSVIIGNRLRGVHKATVENLTQSISQQGLLQAIGVVKKGDRFKLIWGAHRLEAFKKLSIARIPAKVYPEDTPEAELALAELQENYARQELSRTQRQEFAAKILRIGNQADSGNSENFQKHWMDALSEKIGADRRTIQNWWAEFLKDIGADIKPSKATEAEKQRFADWLASKQAEAEAEKQRKATEAQAQRKETEEKDFLEYLDATAKEWGEESVKAWFQEWLSTKLSVMTASLLDPVEVRKAQVGPRQNKDPRSREYAIQTLYALKLYLDSKEADEERVK